MFERYVSKIEDENKRNPLPEDEKLEVWRRDEGKCVLCG